MIVWGQQLHLIAPLLLSPPTTSIEPHLTSILKHHGSTKSILDSLLAFPYAVEDGFPTFTLLRHVTMPSNQWQINATDGKSIDTMIRMDGPHHQ